MQEQSRAYTEMNDISSSLAQLAEKLKTSTSAQKSAEELAAAEELGKRGGGQEYWGRFRAPLRKSQSWHRSLPKHAKPRWLWARNSNMPLRTWD